MKMLFYLFMTEKIPYVIHYEISAPFCLPMQWLEAYVLQSMSTSL